MPWIDERRLPNGLLQPLTKRQGEICHLFARGFDGVEVALALQLNYDHVRDHVTRIANLLPFSKEKPMARVRRWAIEQGVAAFPAPPGAPPPPVSGVV